MIYRVGDNRSNIMNEVASNVKPESGRLASEAARPGFRFFSPGGSITSHHT